MKIEDMLEDVKSQEALGWLRSGNPDSRTLGEASGTAESIALVEELYARGATRVTSVRIETYDGDQQNSGKLIVSLPGDPIARTRLFEWFSDAAKELGFDPDQDTGQRHVLVMLD
jgi:hypothetical protein